MYSWIDASRISWLQYLVNTFMNDVDQIADPNDPKQFTTELRLFDNNENLLQNNNNIFIRNYVAFQFYEG